MSKLRWLSAPLAAALVALLVACGGDKQPDEDTDCCRAEGAGSGVSTELNLSNAAESLLELRSFRFDASLKLDVDTSALSDPDDELSAGFAAMFLTLLKDVKVQGAYVAPDSFDVTVEFAGQTMRVIQIGDRAWINEGSGWQETPATGANFGFLDDPTELAFDLLPQEVLRNAKTKSERVNGVETTRYSFDKQALAETAAQLGEDAVELEDIDNMQLDVWLTSENIPVKLSLEASGSADGADMAIDAEFNVKDLNSNQIKIEAPN